MIGGNNVNVDSGSYRFKRPRKPKDLGLEMTPPLTITFTVDQPFLSGWRGDTVVDITPHGKLYPTYTQRGGMEADTPPMTNKTYQNITKGAVRW